MKYLLFVLLAIPAFAQGTSSNCDNATCKITFTFGGGGGGGGGSFSLGAPFSGAPYSGTQTTENTQTLADGTHIKRPSPMATKMYRDSQGRIRAERPMFPSMPGSKPPAEFDLVQIQDTVAGFIYVLDPIHHVAHRMAGPTNPMPMRPFRAPANITPQTQADGSTSLSESLGTQAMFGVPVVGQRTSMTMPAGSRLGNDRPVTTVNEIWTDPRTGVVVSRMSSNPQSGENTMKILDYSNAEPDPSLFQVPAGYQIVDEQGSFTMVIPRQN